MSLLTGDFPTAAITGILVTGIASILLVPMIYAAFFNTGVAVVENQKVGGGKVGYQGIGGWKKLITVYLALFVSLLVISLVMGILSALAKPLGLLLGLVFIVVYFALMPWMTILFPYALMHKEEGAFQILKTSLVLVKENKGYFWGLIGAILLYNLIGIILLTIGASIGGIIYLVILIGVYSCLIPFSSIAPYIWLSEIEGDSNKGSLGRDNSNTGYGAGYPNQGYPNQPMNSGGYSSQPNYSPSNSDENPYR